METTIIKGYAITFNEKKKVANAFYEVFDPNAFDGVNFEDVVLVSGEYPLARSRNDTLKITVDEKGVHFKGEVPICLLKKKPKHFGIGFKVKREEWINCDTDSPTRIIKEIERLYEISVDN